MIKNFHNEYAEIRFKTKVEAHCFDVRIQCIWERETDTQTGREKGRGLGVVMWPFSL